MTGDSFSAANANTFWRDNFSAGVPDLAAAAGDLFYGTGVNAAARLAKGTAWQSLVMNAGATAPAWVDSVPGIFAAAGDLVYGTAADAAARLALGTAYKILGVNAGATAPSWQTLAALAAAQALVASQAAGDIIYADSATNVRRLAKPTLKSVLKNTSAGVPVWMALADLVGFTYLGGVTNTGWDGDAKNIGTYSFATPNLFHADISSAADAVIFTVSVKWSVASDASYLNIVPTGISSNCLIARSQTANFFQDKNGVVPMNGGFDIIIAGANALAVYVNCWGFFIQGDN